MAVSKFFWTIGCYITFFAGIPFLIALGLDKKPSSSDLLFMMCTMFGVSCLITALLFKVIESIGE